jgi:hypothetical protein
LFGAGGAAADAVRRARKSTIDVLRADLAAFSAAAPAEDRQKVDAHLTAIRDIETRLEQGPVACRRAPRATAEALDPQALENTPAVLGLQQDLLAAALACDVTRVASLQFRVGENDNDRYAWAGVEHGRTPHALPRRRQPDPRTREPDPHLHLVRRTVRAPAGSPGRRA